MKKFIPTLALLPFVFLGAFDPWSMPSIKDVEAKQDVKLLNEISDRLKGRFERYDIDIYVDNGVVILAGTVRSYYEKRAIEQEIQKIGGVTKIRNKIQVRR